MRLNLLPNFDHDIDVPPENWVREWVPKITSETVMEWAAFDPCQAENLLVVVKKFQMTFGEF